MRPKILLVVEDEFLVALDMEMILAEAGFTVLGPAGSVDEGLELLGGQPPDAALLDNNLNGRSAGPIAAALTQMGVPFAFVTGNDRDGLPADFNGAPMVRKPFDQERLIAMARQLTK